MKNVSQRGLSPREQTTQPLPLPVRVVSVGVVDQTPPSVKQIIKQILKKKSSTWAHSMLEAY